MYKRQNQALAFNHEWFRSESSENITLNTNNTEPVGIAWTPTSIAVLNANPLGIYWYGEVGQSFTDIPVVSRSNILQLEELPGENDITFSIGETSFKGVIGRSVRRIFVPDQSPSIIEEQETRITPEYTLNGVRVGMTIRQGVDSYKIKGVYSVNNDEYQSFLC